MIQGSPVCSAYDALQPFLSIQDFTQDQGFHPVANRKPPSHAALVSVQGETVPPATLEGPFIGLERMQSFALEQAHARPDFDPTSLLRAGAPATAANDTTVLLTKPAAKRCV